MHEPLRWEAGMRLVVENTLDSAPVRAAETHADFR